MAHLIHVRHFFSVATNYPFMPLTVIDGDSLCNGHLVCFSFPNLCCLKNALMTSFVCRSGWPRASTLEDNPRIGISRCKGMCLFNLGFTAKFSSQETLPVDGPSCQQHGRCACFPQPQPHRMDQHRFLLCPHKRWETLPHRVSICPSLTRVRLVVFICLSVT